MSYIGTNKVGKMYLGDVAIGKAYLGEDLVFDSAGGSEPVVEPTLIAYWDGEDAPVSGNWVDRIGDKRLKLYGTYTRTNGYYEFLNTSSHNNYVELLDNDFGVDYEIKIVVEFELKPNSNNSMIVLDFCGYGLNSGTWGFGAARTTAGGWFMNTKYNGDNTLTETKTGTYPTLEDGTWNSCVLTVGIEYNAITDEQRSFLMIGDGKRVSRWAAKKKISAFDADTLKPFFVRPENQNFNYYTNIRLKTIKVYDIASENGNTPAPDVLPYDAEVEYLEATGTQWIDTGIIGNQNTRARVKFMPTASGYMYVYGCRGDNSHSITVGSSGSSSTFNCRFGNQTQAMATSVNTIYDVVQDKYKLRINGTETTYGTVSDFTTPDNIYLMWASLDTYSYHCQGRIYFMKILDGDTLVRDFIPVRVGQVGYMYDKVSGQLFGNNGTGSFILGNDK